ncbi:hypothetical protein CDAR_2861 [Caerostris darwini]|uniref:Uncharacterized protein n=1 Tax=Caerostris darwini TaxID=1538125 RepID=A0AAV4TEK3_9ARAC|nr:hypothetical protein CDAR_2861 [Caerostris darwini]
MCSREKGKEFPLEGSRGKLVHRSSLACRIFETQINTVLLVTLSADLVGAPFSSRLPSRFELRRAELRFPTVSKSFPHRGEISLARDSPWRKKFNPSC